MIDFVYGGVYTGQYSWINWITPKVTNTPNIPVRTPNTSLYIFYLIDENANKLGRCVLKLTTTIIATLQSYANGIPLTISYSKENDTLPFEDWSSSAIQHFNTSIALRETLDNYFNSSLNMISNDFMSYALLDYVLKTATGAVYYICLNTEVP